MTTTPWTSPPARSITAWSPTPTSTTPAGCHCWSRRGSRGRSSPPVSPPSSCPSCCGTRPISRRATPSGRTRRASGPAVTQWSLSTLWLTRRPPSSSSIPWSTARCWICARGSGSASPMRVTCWAPLRWSCGSPRGMWSGRSSSPATWATSTSPLSATLPLWRMRTMWSWSPPMATGTMSRRRATPILWPSSSTRCSPRVGTS